MDVRGLRYFVELVRQQSFTKASERMFVTQPTISKMIRNLESELGQPLLHREGRRFWLTEAGEIVYQRAQIVLTQMNELEAELMDLDQLQRGHLRLGIPPMVGHLYAGLFRQYRQRYPNVELTVVEYGGRKIEQALLNGEIDVAMTMLSPQISNELQSIELDNYPIHAVVPENINWKTRQSVRWVDLYNEPLYLYTSEFTLSEHIFSRCHEAGFEPQVAARSSQWDFLVALVKSGTGVCFLPAPLCERNHTEGVLVLPIQPGIDWRLGVVWHRNRYLSKTSEAWLQLCRDYALMTDR
ncbi:LysR family transcriptional regulator [Vibrio navarrensis]|uniref:LysR family transcriptional regulator n=1 Tax=Vibrio navarrensis TaxID=29495 RepID=UPI00155934CB|nr:LysR family transcriptional regulator [Vibrio navarrensis]